MPLDDAEVRGDGRLEKVILRKIDHGQPSDLDSAAMFIFIGAAPSTEMLRRVAEAVAEGSASIFTIHKYLQTV